LENLPVRIPKRKDQSSKAASGEEKNYCRSHSQTEFAAAAALALVPKTKQTTSHNVAADYVCFAWLRI
jgi:hypothetical protein